MNPSLTFASHFSRLVWLLGSSPANVEEQKTALRALVAASAGEAVTISVRGGQLEANGEAVPQTWADARHTAAQLTSHGVREVSVDAGSPAPALLGIARIFAAMPTGAPGDSALERLGALDAPTVRFTLVEHVVVPAAALRQREMARVAEGSLGIVTGDAGMFTHFAAPQTPQGSIEELLARLDAARRADQATSALDDLVTVGENGMRDGNHVIVADVLHGITARESAITNAEIRRAYGLALRRIARPALLRAVAGLLPRRREQMDEYLRVLERAGEDGADAVIEQLTEAQATEDRRVYFDVLVRLKSGVPALIHMLGDARWFVARNAAELLGAMKAREAEVPLVKLLRNADERVRRAASRALIQLDTPAGWRAVRDALHDDAPGVRAHAAAALATRPDGQTGATLTRALEEEEHPDVQLALVAALGRVATRDAVQRLVAMAEPEGRLFRRKPAALRVAAINALAEARTAEALAALRALERDREAEIREAAARALARTAAPDPRAS